MKSGILGGLVLLVVFCVCSTAVSAEPAGNEELAKWASAHPKFLKKFDANHNGKLDGQELVTAKPVWQKKLAAKADGAKSEKGAKKKAAVAKGKAGKAKGKK